MLAIYGHGHGDKVAYSLASAQQRKTTQARRKICSFDKDCEKKKKPKKIIQQRKQESDQ